MAACRSIAGRSGCPLPLPFLRPLPEGVTSERQRRDRAQHQCLTPLDELILHMRDALGVTVVIVTHELAGIFAIGNNSVYLDAESRTMLDHGDPKQLREHSAHETVRRFLARAGTPAP